jgi:hypothetical protein
LLERVEFRGRDAVSTAVGDRLVAGLYFAMIPRKRAALLSALTMVIAACGEENRLTGPSGAALATFLELRSEPGDLIAAGESHRYTLEDTTWLARATSSGVGEPNHVVVTLRPKDGSFAWWWDLHLAAPGDQPLKVGVYENARRWPFHGQQPGVSFSGTGRGCNTLTGAFVIRTLRIGPGNSLDRLHATFEQHCDGRSPALKGEISLAAVPAL